MAVTIEVVLPVSPIILYTLVAPPVRHTEANPPKLFWKKVCIAAVVANVWLPTPVPYVAVDIEVPEIILANKVAGTVTVARLPE